MQITLIHNPTAGDETHSAPRLRAMLREAGHEVYYRSTKGPWKQALERPTDLVVVAGGDGTVSKVAKRLAHTGRPLAVLSIGTANNIGKSLGVVGEGRSAVAAWRDVDRRPLDLGVATAPWGEERFVESLGGGIFAEIIASGEAAQRSEMILGRESDRALYLLHRIVASAEPAHWGIDVDGFDLSGDYLAVEVLNIRFAGPNVPLAPTADPGDGLLDLVVVGPDDRAAIADYATSRMENAAGELPALAVHQGREIRLEVPPRISLHLDDEPWPAAGLTGSKDRAVEIRVDPGAVMVLAGRPG